MRKNSIQTRGSAATLFALFAPLVLILSLFWSLFSHSGAAQNASNLEERIRRVENGLITPVQIKGQAPPAHSLAARMKHHRVPGLSVAVINDGRLEWARGYGVIEAGKSAPVTTATLFQAASISKPVAAMAALRLVERGKLGLDDDVNLKLKSWRVPEHEWARDEKVTLRRLVSHSAGLTVHGFRGYAAGEEVPTLVQALDGVKPANSAAIRVDIRPGSQWRYSGGGYNVMQQLLIDITGKPFPIIMREEVLDRIGMKLSTYEQPLPETRAAQAAIGHLANGEPMKGRWHTYPEMAAAGLWTTPSDLARFALELAQAYAGRSERVISKEMARQMLTEGVGGWGLGIGLGGRDGRASFSHGGSNNGYKCTMFVYRDGEQGAIIMTNGDRGSALANELMRAIAREYDWPDYRPVERTVAEVDQKIYANYTGAYTDGRVRITVEVKGGKMYLTAVAAGLIGAELLPESETEFFMLDDNIRIKFVREEEGPASEMVINVGSQTIRARRAP